MQRIDLVKEEEAARLRGSLQEFTKFFTKHITNRDYIISNPLGRESHQITICRELTSMTRMEHPNENLLINVEPGSGKSLQICMWIAWCYTHNPQCNFIYVSHSATLAGEQTAFIKQIMSSQMFRYLFDVEIAKDTKAKDHFATTSGGHVAAFGSAGAIVGRNAGLPGQDIFSGAVVIDDAHKPDEAFSDTMRDNVIRNYENTIRQRPRGENVPIIFIGQRVHEADLASFFIDNKDTKPWRKVILKALDDAGNALYPEVHSKEYLLELLEKSPYVFHSQFQQNPTPAGGSLFSPEWFLELEREPDFICTFICADTAETARSYNDPSAFSFFGLYEIETFGKKTGQLGLHWIDCLEEWIDAKDLEERFIDFWRECSHHKTPPLLAAIEKKSTGVTLIGALNNMQGLRIKDVQRTAASGSKAVRYIEMQPYVASKRVTFTMNARHINKCKTHMSKITANDAHRHDDICHSAGSKIATTRGYVNVENIKIGDKVITPLGIGTVSACGSTGFHPVIKRFGLESTPDHKIFYDGKFIPLITAIDMTRLSLLSFKDLLLWKQRQLFYLMVKNSDLRHRQDILRLAKENIKTDFFTVLFGSFIQRRRYRKAILYIIKTIINLITVLRIWSVFQIANIARFISKENRLLLNVKRSWRKCGKILKNLSLLQNIRNLDQKDLLSGLEQKNPLHVSYAVLNSKEQDTIKKLALQNANKNGLINGEESVTQKGQLLNQYAYSAEINSQQKICHQKNITAQHALGHVPEDMDIKEVFSLTVDTYGVYYCNNILLQNCDTLYDGVKIALIDKMLHNPKAVEHPANDVMNTIAMNMRRQQMARMNRDVLR